MKKILRIIEKIRYKKIYYIPLVYIGIVIFTFGPIITAMIAGLLGKCLDCNINEAGTDDCIRLGIPFGEVLNMFCVFGWFFLLTIPLGAIAIVAWTIYCIVILIRDKKNKTPLK